MRKVQMMKGFSKVSLLIGLNSTLTHYFISSICCNEVKGAISVFHHFSDFYFHKALFCCALAELWYRDIHFYTVCLCILGAVGNERKGLFVWVDFKYQQCFSQIAYCTFKDSQGFLFIVIRMWLNALTFSNNNHTKLTLYTDTFYAFFRR